jgi:hypothetical protein
VEVPVEKCNFITINTKTMENILLYSITPEEFFEKLRTIVREEIKAEIKQDQLLTKDGALKIAGISNATFMKAIAEGIVKPQLVKGRNRAMYLESEVVKIEKKRKNG